LGKGTDKRKVLVAANIGDTERRVRGKHPKRRKKEDKWEKLMKKRRKGECIGESGVHKWLMNGHDRPSVKMD